MASTFEFTPLLTFGQVRRSTASLRCAPEHIGRRVSGPFTISPPPTPAHSPRGHRGPDNTDAMGDIWVVLGIAGFIAAMLGLIWCLERV
jgi:hypothetical protein